MFYLFVNMLGAFLQALCKSNSFMLIYNLLYVSLEVDILFFLYEGLRDVCS
jgi:hypothetical protein